MKLYKYICTCLLLLSSLGFIGCTNNFEKYNTNPYDASDEDLLRDDYRLRAAIISMQGNVMPINTFLYQFMEASLGNTYGGYMSDSNDGFMGKNFSCYTPEEHWLQFPFNNVIPDVYSSYLDITNNTQDPVLLSVADVLKVAAIHRVTDIYGHIPYSKVGNNGELEAPYDHQKDLYDIFFKQLDSAIETLTKYRTANFSAFADKVYGGVTEQWIKYANSLKLRLAMRVVYANPELAKQKAEEAVNHEVGVFKSNADNAFNQVAKSPIREVMYDYNGGDSRISADITSYMNGYNDPRREAYFLKSTFTAADGDIKNGYHGLRNGITIGTSATAQKYSNVNMSKLEGALLWMNAAECAFLQAEGALRNWNMQGASAENWYKIGIKLSFEQWGVSGADAYSNNTELTPESYRDPLGMNDNADAPATITIGWENSSDFEKNLERIITQKWIANFPLGNEAWAEYRRTGYPRLMKVTENLSNGVVDHIMMARRLPYPRTEYTENTKYLNQALEMLGGPDNMATRVWWDCNTRIH